MKVKDLVGYCYDTIIIYKSVDKEYGFFKDLYKGKRENIDSDLLELEVGCFGAKKYGVTEIEGRLWKSLDDPQG